MISQPVALKTLRAALVVGLLLGATASTAYAIPAFARKYQTSCQTCHIILNAKKGFALISISPNPVVNSNFKLNVTAAQKTKMEIVITDMQGRMMQKQSVNLIAGFNTLPMNVTNLSAGTYQVYGITADGRSRVLRFVIPN